VSKNDEALQRVVGQSGSGWYVISYVGNSIRKHKTRSLSLLLGVLIGVSLVTSVFVWTDTGTRVAIDDYFEDNIFQFSVQQRSGTSSFTGLIHDVKDWADPQPLTESSYVIYRSYGLLGVTDMGDGDPYMPFPYSLGIKDAEVFFASDAFLEAVETKFNFTGSFSIEPGHCLVSQKVVNDVEAVLNQTITIGSVIDIALATIYDDPTTIGDLNRLNITNVQVDGIYNLPVSDSVLYNAFDGISRQNYPATGLEPVFGWNDGIILHTDEISESEKDALVFNEIFPKLLIRLSSTNVLTYGLDRVVSVIRGYKLLLESDFNQQVAVAGERQLIHLEDYIVAYLSRRTMGVLVAPVIVLSVFLTTFATNIFLSGRRAEVAILRARGASFRQLYAAFIFEFFVIGIVGQCAGMFLSLFIGSLIPASTGFLQFDMVIFFRFFSVVRLLPYTWIIAAIACLIPPLIFTMIYVRSFLRTEIYQAMVGVNPPGESDIGVIILYFTGCVAFLAFFFFIVIILPSSPSVAILQFIYAVALWTLLSDSGSRVVRRGMAGITRFFRPVFGEKTAIFVKSMRTRRQRIVPLLLILTLTFSLTVFSVVEAQTVQINADRQIEYFIGADLRIESDWVPCTRVDEIRAVSGVSDATPLVRTLGLIGQTALYFIGVDVDSYSTIGYWDASSMTGEDAATVLNRMKNDPDAIIFPSTLADMLQKSVGKQIGIYVYDQTGGLADDHVFNIVGLGHSAPGLGYFDPDDPSRPTDATSGFQFQEDGYFVFVHINYLESLNITNSRLFLGSLESDANIEQIQYDTEALGFPTAIHSPSIFSLEDVYPDGYLFNRGVVSILSIGFLACLSISMIALILFVGVIVAERQTEYAIMRAVGGTRRQIIAIVVGEFIGLILSSFFVSILLGSAFSWLLMNVLLNLFPFPYVVPFPIILPWMLLLIVLGSVIVGMSIGTYVPARRAGRTNVGRVLRNL
jgi:ABC-type antimicrobial peptide transport system permease subunit